MAYSPKGRSRYDYNEQEHHDALHHFMPGDPMGAYAPPPYGQQVGVTTITGSLPAESAERALKDEHPEPLALGIGSCARRQEHYGNA